MFFFWMFFYSYREKFKVSLNGLFFYIYGKEGVGIGRKKRRNRIDVVFGEMFLSRVVI